MVFVDVDVDEINGLCWVSTLAYPNLLGIKRICLLMLNKRGVPSAESSRSVRGLGKGVSGRPYPRMCNARRPRLKPGTFRSQAARLQDENVPGRPIGSLAPPGRPQTRNSPFRGEPVDLMGR